ncbi:E3 ubiquitin-protein ligase SINAT3 [Gryllus bimaculatus]|nr:E3 ubiquitin-protein ligase SINAT3 [Gryllus bimaculatus]
MSAAVSADQLNSFLEKLDILCEKLKVEDCPICDLKLTEERSTCTNGHGICGSCKLVVNVCPVCYASYPGDEPAQGASAHSPPKRSRQSTENGEDMNVDESGESGDGKRCINAPRGCQALISESELVAHEMYCPFRLYTCKICNVEFCLRKLQGHCERSHKSPNRVIKNDVFLQVSPNDVQNCDRVYFFLHVHNEIFWFWRNNTERFVYFGLQYCGDPDKANKFQYTLEVVSLDKKSSLKFGGPVLFDTPEMPRYTHSEDYIMIGKNMIGAESKFKVTVRKV